MKSTPHTMTDKAMHPRYQNESEELQFLRHVTNSGPTLVFVKDSQGRFTYTNLATARFYHSTQEELLGQIAVNCTPDPSRAAPSHLDDLSVIDSGQQKTITEEIIDGGGTTHTMQTVKQPLAASPGHVPQVLCIATDITLRASTEKELRASQARFRSIIEDQTEMISRATPDGICTFVNGAYCRWHYQTEEELIGRSFLHRIHEDDRQRCIDDIKNLTAGNPVISHEFRVYPKSDLNSRWTIWHTRGIFDDNGQMAELQSVGRDVTEQKVAEEELKRRNDALIALSTIATTISELQNIEEILKVTLQKTLEAVHMDSGWIQLLDNSSVHKRFIVSQNLSPRMVKQIKSGTFEQFILNPANEQNDPIIIALDASSTASHQVGVLQAEGIESLAYASLKTRDQSLGFMGCCTSIPRQLGQTEIQILSSAARQISIAVENARLVEEATEIEIIQKLDRLRSELIDNVSHELRTPLGLIKLFSTTLLRTDIDVDSETQSVFLQNIVEEIAKLESITDHLLDLSLLEKHQLKLDQRNINICQLLENTLQSIKPQFSEHRFTFTPTNSPVMVFVDPYRIEQVLRNLLINAAKYSPGHAQITSKISLDHDRVVVSIHDQGIGIPNQEIPKVFQRFYRVENELTRKVGGAGLGLAVCKGIIDAHQGQIWVTSTPGQGSSFYFSIPHCS
jgi:two-component system, sensor histidine kinase and response regulator